MRDRGKLSFPVRSIEGNIFLKHIQPSFPWTFSKKKKHKMFTFQFTIGQMSSLHLHFTLKKLFQTLSSFISNVPLTNETLRTINVKQNTLKFTDVLVQNYIFRSETKYQLKRINERNGRRKTISYIIIYVFMILHEIECVGVTETHQQCCSSF